MLAEGVELVAVNEGQECVEAAHAHGGLFLSDEALLEGVCQLVQIHDFHTTGRVDDDICQKVCDGELSRVMVHVVIHYVTVPVKERIVITVELAYLDPFLEDIGAGPVAELRLGVESFPLRDQYIRVVVDDLVILQQDTFGRYDALAVQFHDIHENLLESLC